MGYRPGEARPELDLAGTVAVPAMAMTRHQLASSSSGGPPSERKPRRRHLLLDISIIAGVVVIYVLSLLGYH